MQYVQIITYFSCRTMQLFLLYYLKSEKNTATFKLKPWLDLSYYKLIFQYQSNNKVQLILKYLLTISIIHIKLAKFFALN